MRDRTADLLHAMQALSQLSYSPKGVPDSRLTTTRILLAPNRLSILCVVFQSVMRLVQTGSVFQGALCHLEHIGRQ